MQRRKFVELTGLGLAGAALTGCATSASQPAEQSAMLDAGQFHASRRSARTRFGRIAYVERGTGEAALFLHGFPLSGFQWRGALQELQTDRRCIAPDLLGLGHTEVAAGQSVDPDAQVAMLSEFLDALGVRQADVVASDSGGAVAQLLLVRHPERVRSLLLTNCDAETDSPPPALLPIIELCKAGTFADEWLGRWLADKTLARSARGIGGMCYADPAHPTDEAIESYFAPAVASAERKALVHAYCIALERNPLAGIAPHLQRSRAPVRIVWGMGDTIFSPQSPGYLDRTLGNSQGVRRLDGSKLFWPEERPDIVAEEARRLWKLSG